MQESTCNAGALGLIPRSGRSPKEGIRNPLQYSCLDNPMDRGTRQAIVHRVARVGHNLATKPHYNFVELNELLYVKLFVLVGDEMI